MKRTRLNIFIFLCFLSGHLLAQKTDTIVHINGNVLTGDFKKMVYGVVTWKMDGMGTISVEEVKIKTIISKKEFEIKMRNGNIYFGSMDSSGVDGKVHIVLESERKLINLKDIVEVYPIKRNFWMRTSGNFSLGGNYSKGSNIATLATSGNLTYRKLNTYFNLSWDDNSTYQGDSISSSNSELALAWQRIFKNNWSSQIEIGVSQNTALGIKRKLGVGITGIKDISYNSWNRLYVGAGFIVSNEIPIDDSNNQDNLAGLLQFVWKVYKYTIPKVGVDANINFAPYITNAGRYTASFNLNPNISILNDNFKVGFKFYYNYDNRPVSEDASTDDYGINLQLTYSFH